MIVREERQEKLMKHAKQMEYEVKHKRNLENRNPYGTKVSQASISNSR